MTSWFDTKDLVKHKVIKLSDLHGYVLPHAGTKYTGEIISHTLRFRSTKKIKTIYILYYPSQDKPNVKDMYHEYYVPMMSLRYFFNGIKCIGINLREVNYVIPTFNNSSLYVVSADFSHFLPMNKAIELENKAAHSLMFRKLEDTEYNRVVDDTISFNNLYSIIPKSYQLQWVGRSRSVGDKGVGYLSFLIRESPKPNIHKPDGMFVTVYDKDMNSRECLGEWFIHKKWSSQFEQDFIQDVLYKARTTSRLTGGINTDIPITNYTITYLYKDKTLYFIRGFHGIKKDSFYLSDVFLENTYENGKWIQREDVSWLSNKNMNFDLLETFQKLSSKAGKYNKKTLKKRNKYQLYTERVLHQSI